MRQVKRICDCNPFSISISLETFDGVFDEFMFVRMARFNHVPWAGAHKGCGANEANELTSHPIGREDNRCMQMSCPGSLLTPNRGSGDAIWLIVPCTTLSPEKLPL